VKNAKHNYSLPLVIDAEDDSVGEVDEVPDVLDEFLCLGDTGAAARKFLEGVNGGDKLAEPTLSGFWFLVYIPNESDILFCILEPGRLYQPEMPIFVPSSSSAFLAGFTRPSFAAFTPTRIASTASRRASLSRIS